MPRRGSRTSRSWSSRQGQFDFGGEDRGLPEPGTEGTDPGERGAGQLDGEDRNSLDSLTAFLSHAALEAGEEQAAEGEDLVSLMTLHSAKGLEFPFVFICGMEEGLFPHSRSSEDPGKLEEERRLCYVGMTRAKRSLCLSFAESRRLYGNSDRYSTPSRFLRELPPERIEEVRLRGTVSRPGWRVPPRRRGTPEPVHDDSNGLRLGQRVQHPSSARAWC